MDHTQRIIAEITAKLTLTRDILWNNMLKMIDRGSTSERLLIMSESLEASSGVFQEETAKRVPKKRPWICTLYLGYAWFKIRQCLYSLTNAPSAMAVNSYTSPSSDRSSGL